MRLPSHQAVRLFLLTFATGLVVLVVGALIAATLPKRTIETQNSNTAYTLTGDDLSQVTVHVRGVITALSDHSFTIVTQGISDVELPETLTVRYTDNILSSVDTAVAPDPVNAKTVTATPITPDELTVGSTVDVTASGVTKDSTEIDAAAVLQIL